PILLFKRGDKFFLDIQKTWCTNTMKGRLNVHNTGGHYSRSPIDNATKLYMFITKKPELMKGECIQ
ncbi:hypothetical protein, partial [Desulfobacterium sp. N47]|uniref:hypothetical protein n=1 Tax=Desulfobacterium sp. N47 TaxID=3115210 RepID=UPI003F4A2E2B